MAFKSPQIEKKKENHCNLLQTSFVEKPLRANLCLVSEPIFCFDKEQNSPEKFEDLIGFLKQFMNPEASQLDTPSVAQNGRFL